MPIRRCPLAFCLSSTYYSVAKHRNRWAFLFTISSQSVYCHVIKMLLCLLSLVSQLFCDFDWHTDIQAGALAFPSLVL